LFRGVDATGQRSKTTRHQVVGPCRIEDGTAYAQNCVALERNTPSGIPAAGRFHETESAGSPKFATIDMVREGPTDLSNDPIDHGQRSRKVFEAHHAFGSGTDSCINDSAFVRSDTSIS
jgi:hypothetical protein